MLKGHAGAEALVWAADASRLASLGDDGELHIWPIGAAGDRMLVDRRLYAADVDPVRNLLALVSGDDEVMIHASQQLNRDPIRLPRSERCRAAANDRSGLRVLRFDGASGDLWRVGADGRVERWRNDAGRFERLLGVCVDATLAAYAASPAATMLLDVQKRLVRVDGTAARVLDSVPVEGEPVAFQVSPDGRWVVVGTADGHLVLWDLAAQPIARSRWRPHAGEPLCVALDQATGWVLSTYRDGLAAWSNATTPPNTWKGDGNWMESCAAKEGVGLVAASSGRLWRFDRSSRAEPLDFADDQGVAHVGSITTLAIDGPEGILLSGGGMDGQVRLWDMHRRRLAASVFMQGTVTAVAIDELQGNAYLVSEGGLVRRLPLSLSALQSMLRTATSATLTPAERGNFLNEPVETAYAHYVEQERAHRRLPLSVAWRFKIPF